MLDPKKQTVKNCVAPLNSMNLRTSSQYRRIQQFKQGCTHLRIYVTITCFAMSSQHKYSEPAISQPTPPEHSESIHWLLAQDPAMTNKQMSFITATIQWANHKADSTTSVHATRQHQ